MKILQMLTSIAASSAGSERSVTNLASKLCDRGHSFSIALGPECAQNNDVIVDDRIHVIRGNGIFDNYGTLPYEYIKSITGDKIFDAIDIINSYDIWQSINYAADKLPRIIDVMLLLLKQNRYMNVCRVKLKRLDS